MTKPWIVYLSGPIPGLLQGGDHMKQEPEKECATCRYAGASMLENPCRSCLIQTRKGDEYPKWEPQEDDE